MQYPFSPDSIKKSKNLEKGFFERGSRIKPLLECVDSIIKDMASKKTRPQNDDYYAQK